MDFLKNIGRWWAPKQVTKTYNESQWTVIAGGSSTENERDLLARNMEWVFVAADKIGKSVAGVRFKVMRYKANGDDQEIFQGPMVSFLEMPGPQFTGKDFLYLTTVYKELTGNSFWEKLKGKGISPLIPTNITPVMEGSKLLGYKYSEGAKQRYLSVDDVLHDRYIDPQRPYWGVGKLAKIGRWVDTSFFSNEFLRRFFINGASFGGFIESEADSEERINLIKLGLQQSHAGVQNAHKWGVLPKGSKATSVAQKMSDIEMGATDDRYRDKILAAFGVPKTLVGLTTEVNRASAEASEYIYAKYTIKPIVDDLIEFLNVNVAPLFDTAGNLYFAYDEFVPKNQEIILKEREIALNKQPYMTVNEVRATVGLPKVPGGDVVYGNAMQVPLGEEPPTDPTKPQDNPNVDEPKKAMPARARAFQAKERALEAIVEKIAQVAAAHHDTDAESHKAFAARVDAHEDLIAGKVRDFNNRQQRDVIQNLKQITKAISKGDLFDMDGEVAVLIDFVGPMLKGLMVEQAMAEYLAQDLPGTLDSNASSLSRIVDLAAKRLAASYNDTTAKLLKTALNDGISAGEDLYQLTERVKAVYEFSDTVRAKAVARTESFYIANAGSKEAYRQSGVVKTMRWYTADAERVCEFCRPMNGKTIAITQTFFNKGDTVVGDEGGKLVADYRAIDVPPLHTNCRCRILPETIEI